MTAKPGFSPLPGDSPENHCQKEHNPKLKANDHGHHSSLLRSADTRSSDRCWSGPRSGPCHHQLGLDLEAIVFGGFHCLPHRSKDRFGPVRVPPRSPQRPKPDPLQAEALVGARCAFVGVRQFCVHDGIVTRQALP
jgi:hypothetical protein